MMSTTLTAGTSFELPWAPSRAVGPEALLLKTLVEGTTDYDNSYALGEPRRLAREALDTAFARATSPNWDGMGAAAADPSAYFYAAQFLSALPTTDPVPDITAEPDGEIALEWDFGPRRILSISIGRDGTLTYASLVGHAKTHGVEHFREGIPYTVAMALERVTGTPGY